MNLLAHQYLSFGDEDLMAGNFIADTIKGADLEAYPRGVAAGIKLHRSIDRFTDGHTLSTQTRALLYPYFHKYALVVQDVFYDHFLACDRRYFQPDTLELFTRRVYEVLHDYRYLMNERALRTLSYMSRDNWLYHYRDEAGVDRALKGLARRASHPSGMEHAIPALRRHYSAMESHFRKFFPQLETFVRAELGLPKSSSE